MYVYIYIYIFRAFGHLPPDPFLGSWNVGRWFPVACNCWSLLLCDCWLMTCSVKLFEPQEGIWRALRRLWDGSGMARVGARIAYEALGKCWAAHE